MKFEIKLLSTVYFYQSLIYEYVLFEASGTSVTMRANYKANICTCKLVKRKKYYLCINQSVHTKNLLKTVTFFSFISLFPFSLLLFMCSTRKKVKVKVKRNRMSTNKHVCAAAASRHIIWQMSSSFISWLFSTSFHFVHA
jgi:hypothetical protein